MAETAGGYDSGITVASGVFAFVTATFILTTEITCSKSFNVTNILTPRRCRPMLALALLDWMTLSAALSHAPPSAQRLQHQSIPNKCQLVP